MRLYLVRHGDAVSEEVDPERRLSENGRADVQRVAAFLAGAGVRVPVILHSGKKRAEQTAGLLAGSVGTGVQPEQVSGIDPFDPTAEFAQTVNEWTTDTMVVGHLPFVGKLVSRLVVKDESASTVLFPAGTVVCLECDQHGRWSIAWMIRPELLHDPG